MAFYDGDDPWILDHAPWWAEEGFSAAADLTGLEPPTEKIFLVMYASAQGWDIKSPKTDSDVLHIRGFVLPYH
jgi:hypothetical protein